MLIKYMEFEEKFYCIVKVHDLFHFDIETELDFWSNFDFFFVILELI